MFIKVDCLCGWGLCSSFLASTCSDKLVSKWRLHGKAKRSVNPKIHYQSIPYVNLKDINPDEIYCQIAANFLRRFNHKFEYYLLLIGKNGFSWCTLSWTNFQQNQDTLCSRATPPQMAFLWLVVRS